MKIYVQMMTGNTEPLFNNEVKNITRKKLKNTYIAFSSFSP